jgi:hypothetical protein
MLPLLAFGGKQQEVGAYDDGDDNRPPSISMIPSLSKININVKYESLRDLERKSLDTVVNKDNFMLITELNQLKTMMDSINKVKQRVDAIAERSATTLTQSDFVTMMEEALSANDFELLKEYNKVRLALVDFNTFKEFLEKKYGEAQMAFLFNQFSENAFELLEDYNRIVEERKFAKLSLFLKAIDKDTGEPKYIPLEYDHSTGLAGINMKRSMDFQRIYLGHDPIVGFSDEAEYRQWGSMPDGIGHPIGWESMQEYMNDEGPFIFHIAAPGAKPIQLFASISHNRDDGYNSYMKPDELWLNEEERDEEPESPFETVYPDPSSAYYVGAIEELTFADDSLVDEDVFPGLIQIMEDETLFNPVFWYEFDEMKQAVYSEGEDQFILQIQNVGLAYYAIPSKLLAWAVDKLTDRHATKRTRQ